MATTVWRVSRPVPAAVGVYPKAIARLGQAGLPHGFDRRLVVSVNQAYFMGLLLLISAYFVPGSYERKGPGRLLADRLIRPGIPLAVFSWVLDPLFVYGDLTLAGEVHMPLGRFSLPEHFSEYDPCS